MKKINIILIILSIFFCIQFVSAASIGVKPERIEMSGVVGGQLLQEILVFNAGVAPGTYVLTADGIKFIQIEPKEFVLEAGAERLVKISTKNYLPKNIKTNISVISRPLDASGLLASAGVKIPLQIYCYFSQIQTIIIAFCLALIIMILFKLFGVKKKKL